MDAQQIFMNEIEKMAGVPAAFRSAQWRGGMDPRLLPKSQFPERSRGVVQRAIAHSQGKAAARDPSFRKEYIEAGKSYREGARTVGIYPEAGSSGQNPPGIKLY